MEKFYTKLKVALENLASKVPATKPIIEKEMKDIDKVLKGVKSKNNVEISTALKEAESEIVKSEKLVENYPHIEALTKVTLFVVELLTNHYATATTQNYEALNTLVNFLGELLEADIKKDIK